MSGFLRAETAESPAHHRVLTEKHNVRIESGHHTDLVVAANAVSATSTFPTILPDPHAIVVTQYSAALPQVYEAVTKVTLTHVTMPYRPIVHFIYTNTFADGFTPVVGNLVQYATTQTAVITEVLTDTFTAAVVGIRARVTMGDWSLLDGKYDTLNLVVGAAAVGTPNTIGTSHTFRASIHLEYPSLKLHVSVPGVGVVKQGVQAGVQFTDVTVPNTWFPSVYYAVNDVVRVGSSLYRCQVAHVATTTNFTDDNTGAHANYWGGLVGGFVSPPPSIPKDQRCVLVLDRTCLNAFPITTAIAWKGDIEIALPTPQTLRSIDVQWLNMDNTLYEPPWIDYGDQNGMYQPHSIALELETTRTVSHARNFTRPRVA